MVRRDLQLLGELAARQSTVLAPHVELFPVDIVFRRQPQCVL
jgi:hypothetical protein